MYTEGIDDWRYMNIIKGNYLNEYKCAWFCLGVFYGTSTLMPNAVYIYIYIYIYIYKSKVFGHPQTCLFLILKVLFLIKQVEHHDGFIYYTKYEDH